MVRSSDLDMRQAKTWKWDLEEMKEGGTMDNLHTRTSPVIQAFTPVNQSPALRASLDEGQSNATPAEKSETTKRPKKQSVTASCEGRKRKASDVSQHTSNVNEPAKTPRTRKPRANLKDNDISKGRQRTKPGISRNISAEQHALTISSTPSTSNPFIGNNPLILSENEHQQACNQPLTARSKSAHSALGQSYQNVFPTQANAKGDEKQQRNSASSVTLLGSFETMMEKMIDDDIFFKVLDDRPRKSAIPIDSSLPFEDQRSCTSPREAQQPEHAIPGERDFVSQEGHSFFDEALEPLAFEVLDVARLSPSLIDPADDADPRISTVIHSDRMGNLGPSSLTGKAQETSDQPQHLPAVEPNAPCGEVKQVDSLSLDDDDFAFSDQEGCFDVDYNKLKEHAITKTDILIHEDIEILPEDPFADEDLDAELLNLSTVGAERVQGQSPPFTQRTPPGSKFQWAPHTPNSWRKLGSGSKIRSKDAESTAVSARKPLSKISPNTAPHQISFAKDGKALPFIRPPFPTPLLPRSPIPGLSPTTVLRTCFRIGEALNAAALALRSSLPTDALIELYCRIKHSGREANGYKQYFEFADLFKPDNPPILNGVYSIWKGVELWEYDSRVFLGEKGRGKMARVVGRINREEGGKGWEMKVLSIWEAGWEDVGVVKGVVCS